VPAGEAEAQRHRHRDWETLKRERASTTTRIQGVLSTQGIQVTTRTKFPEPLEALQLWDGSPIPPGLRARLLRGDAHHTFLSQQIAESEAERRALPARSLRLRPCACGAGRAAGGARSARRPRGARGRQNSWEVASSGAGWAKG
jgi:hypothetical protein